MSACHEKRNPLQASWMVHSWSCLRGTHTHIDIHIYVCIYIYIYIQIHIYIHTYIYTYKSNITSAGHEKRNPLQASWMVHSWPCLRLVAAHRPKLADRHWSPSLRSRGEFEIAEACWEARHHLALCMYVCMYVWGMLRSAAPPSTMYVCMYVWGMLRSAAPPSTVKVCMYVCMNTYNTCMRIDMSMWVSQGTGFLACMYVCEVVYNQFYVCIYGWTRAC